MERYEGETRCKELLQEIERLKAERDACGWAFDAGMREAEIAAHRALGADYRIRIEGLLERLEKRDAERAKHRADLGKAQQRLFEARKDEMKAREDKDAAVAAERERCLAWCEARRHASLTYEPGKGFSDSVVDGIRSGAPAPREG